MTKTSRAELLLSRIASAGLSCLLCATAGGSSGCVNPVRDGRVVPMDSGDAPPPVGNNLLKVATFDSTASAPWSAIFSSPADGQGEVRDGAYCLTIRNAGQNRWDAQIRHRDMIIQKGHHYSVQFRAWATQETDAYPKVGMSGPPYVEYFGKVITLRNAPQTFQTTFDVEAPDDPTAEFALHVGGELARGQLPLTLCIHDVYLSDPQYEPLPEVAARRRPDVRVNQVGYLPGAEKVAAVVSDSREPLKWKLVDAAGDTVAEGDTQVF